MLLEHDARLAEIRAGRIRLAVAIGHGIATAAFVLWAVRRGGGSAALGGAVFAAFVLAITLQYYRLPLSLGGSLVIGGLMSVAMGYGLWAVFTGPGEQEGIALLLALMANAVLVVFASLTTRGLNEHDGP